MASADDAPEAPWAVELYEGPLEKPRVSYHAVSVIHVDGEVVKMKTADGETFSRQRDSICKLLLVRTK